jgi:hypothetical protein
MKTIEKHVELQANDRELLKKIVRANKSKAKEKLHAKILLRSDRSQEDFLTPTQIEKEMKVSKQTVLKVKKSFFAGGIESAVFRKKRERPPVSAKITGDIEAKIIQIACSAVPAGHNKWALRLIADKAVELKYVDGISHMTVKRLLKKHNLSLT